MSQARTIDTDHSENRGSGSNGADSKPSANGQGAKTLQSSPITHHSSARGYVVTVHERSFQVNVSDGPKGPVVEVDGQSVDIELHPTLAPMLAGRIAGVPFRAAAKAKAESAVVVLGGESLQVEVQDRRRQLLSQVVAGPKAAVRGQVVKAPMPGLVVGVPVTVGQTVAKGASVAVLQAMKMENELRATAEGKVVEVRVQVGQTVDQGQVLVILE